MSVIDERRLFHPSHASDGDASPHDLSPSPRALDLADTDLAERAIFACGTIAPGQVHEPCQHSTVQVLCCTCAGCTSDLWSCGRSLPRDSYAWYEADVIGAWFGTTPALILLALMVLVVLTSHVIELVAWMVALIVALGIGGLILGAGALLR